MFDKTDQSIIIFVLASLLLILILITFIAIIFYRYQQKQNAYFKDIEALKIAHENAILQSQLEIQEQTFQHISREIHDNIGQKLTLAKLHLNTLNYSSVEETLQVVTDSVNIIGEAINDLSDLSHSMSSEMLLNNGLINALEFEVEQLQKTGLYQIQFSVNGNAVFLSAQTELVLFRIVQESVNNIIKHASATAIKLQLEYETGNLLLYIHDNGIGFNTDGKFSGTGLPNIKKRVALLNGRLDIESTKGNGTQITITIPINENDNTVYTATGR
ncbi:MAG: sensor histidine kinase [Bacteroidetes bacterium]|nr:sensor histidine kinase [Bacteroidota bacterium]